MALYYKSVNRGLAFTKPGLYVFALVLLIGMIAVTTGINGLYVFLSAGLGGFIVSGLLSEKAMKSCAVTSVASGLVDAGASFTVDFRVENSSPWFSAYALDVLLLVEPPRFRLVSRRLTGVAGSRLARVAPGGHTFSATGAGLPRGRYAELLAVQQTTFPFGVLEKFKVQAVPAALVVAPAVDADALAAARELLRQGLAALDADREFFGHRPYTPHDGLKDLDWRKSANRPSGTWVVKNYRSPSADQPLCLDAPWAVVAGARDEAAYEQQLRRVRSAVKALEESGRPWFADLGSGLTLTGHEACLGALAGAPRFADRAAGLALPKTAGAAKPRPAPSALARLVVTSDSLTWADGPRAAAGRGGRG